MIKQDFSVNSLLRVTNKHDIIKFKLGREEKDYKKTLEPVSDFIKNKEVKFQNITKIKIKNKYGFKTDDIHEHYILKKIAYDLKRLYRIYTTNRDDISEQLLNVLETGSAYSIIRLDVESFYESVKISDVVNKIENDKLLSSSSIKYLKLLCEVISDDLLPRGLSISPILSELYVRDLDKKIKAINGIYYYARYVDDIIIVSTMDKNYIYNKVKEVFEQFSLSVNKKEYRTNIDVINVNQHLSNSFEYLGYKYNIKNYDYQKRRVVNVSLSDDKVRKIKMRIVSSLLDYSITKDNKLLLNRLLLLSGNYNLISKKNTENALKAGVFYSNRLVNDAKVYNQFNYFLKSALYTKKKNSFSRRINNIPKYLKVELGRIDFVSGFKNKETHEFSIDEIMEIKKCWKNKNYKKQNK